MSNLIQLACASYQPDPLNILEQQAQARWDDLSKHLRKWFHEPDLEALAIAYAVQVAHYFRHDDPVWLMVLGPAGTGKTSTVMACLESLPETYRLDDLTPSTFLSGLRLPGSKADFSLLHRIGTPNDRSGTLLMPDFTCFMSKRDDTRREIAGQLRRIYDGAFDRATGSAGRMEWQGKITLIAAATPAVERAWGLMRDLGERFLQVRWPRGNGIEQGIAAQAQIGNEQEFKALTAELSQRFVDLESNTLNPVKLTARLLDIGLVHLAEMVALLRGHVIRYNDSQHEIVEVPQPEGPTRIMKGLAQVARAHATLFRRTEIVDRDWRVARRLAIDSCPPARWKLVETISGYGDEISWAQLVKLSGIPPTSVTRHMEDLQALDCVIIDASSSIEKVYMFTERFHGLWRLAQPILGV